jgi:hypothetical protein
MMLRLRLLVTAMFVAGGVRSVAAQSPGAAPARDSTDAIGKPGALTTLETGVLNAMSDRNIVAHLIVEDSTEAALCESVAEVMHDSVVSAFAKTLATDHAHALDLDRALVPNLRGLPQLARGDTTDTRMLQAITLRVRGLGPAPALGPTFVSAEVVHHLHLVNELGALRATAMQAHVQRRIDDALAVERAHLARARALARGLGLPSP